MPVLHLPMEGKQSSSFLVIQFCDTRCGAHVYSVWSRQSCVLFPAPSQCFQALLFLHQRLALHPVPVVFLLASVFDVSLSSSLPVFTSHKPLDLIELVLAIHLLVRSCGTVGCHRVNSKIGAMGCSTCAIS